MAILPNASEMTIENLLISYVEDRVDLTILFIYLFIFIIYKRKLLKYIL